MPEQGRDGRFVPGNSGGPGRPKGSTSYGVAEFRRLVNGDLESVVAAVLQNAKGGDNSAAKLVLDRMFPTQNFQLTQIEERLAALESLFEPDHNEEDPGAD